MCHRIYVDYWKKMCEWEFSKRCDFATMYDNTLAYNFRVQFYIKLVKTVVEIWYYVEHTLVQSIEEYIVKSLDCKLRNGLAKKNQMWIDFAGALSTIWWMM